MKYLKLTRSLSSIFFLLSLFCINSFAQCEGVYFKTANRKLFTSPVVFVADQGLTASRFTDITGDGEIDFIGTGKEEGNNTRKIYISPGDGNGNFGSLIELTLASPIMWGNAFSVLDFNNDGLKDFFFHFATQPPTVGIYQNNGNNTFTPLSLTILPSNEYIENKVDINNDNRVDLITITPVNVHNYRLGNADGSFGSPVQIAQLNYSFSGDFNSDGKVDFALVFGATPNYTLRMYYNQGGGSFSLSNDLLNLGASGNLVAVRDFNNDGKPDLLATGNTQGQFTVITNLGSNSFSKTDFPTNPVTESNIYIQDFTGDGFLDLLTLHQLAFSLYSRSYKPYSVFTNNGSGGFTRRDYDVPLRGFPAGDIDGDNKADLVTFNDFNFNGANQVPIRLFNETQISYTKNVCKKPGQTKIVDFNGDNTADKAFFRPSDGRWRFSNQTVNWGLSGDITQPGDYDGDGKTDVAVYRPSNGTWYIINSSNGTYTIIQFGIGEDKPVSSDFDGDETSDIAVFRPSDGNWYIYHTGTGQVSITHFGISEDKPVQEDFDGDGKTDLAVFRPSTGVWYYLRSSDGNFAAINWGISTDVPLPADYDGDGKADFAVYRASEGNWYFLRSFNFEATVYRFGTTGDIPQVSDWDGNGIFDAGIFRPSANVWYFSHSQFLESFGSAGEIPASSILRTE